MRVIGRFVNYCKKHNYWKDELERRSIVKPIIIPSKQEIKESKILKRRLDLIKYGKKVNHLHSMIKMYEKKISNTNKSIKMLRRCNK